MRFLAALALMAVLAVASRSASAQSAHPYELFLSDWRPPPGQRCDLGNTPALDALLDTAAFYARVSAVTHGSVLFAWTRPDTIGWRPEYGPMMDSMFVVERRMSDSTATLVHDALLAALRQSDDAPSQALLRLDFDGRDGRPVFRTAPSLQCPPAVIEDSSRARSRARLRAIAGKEPRNAVIGFMVGRDGATHESRVITSSGDDKFDSEALAASAVLHYRPALYNRVPVAVYVRLPVRAQQRMQ
ncbi:MAG TPA: TonB family protein [Gemmatimonadales bacterium]